MHAVVGDWDEFKVEVLHSIDFELEGESRFKMAVDAVLAELHRNNKNNLHNC